jgi:hypothetical protein
MMLHYPTKSDLLVAEMLYILTHGVDMIRNGALDKHEGEPNITGYLITTIAKHLQHSADQDRLMLGAGRAKGKTVRVSPLTRDVVTNEQLLNEKGVPRYEYEAALNQCLMPIERTVLELRVEGWNDTQIGEKLNCTKQYVQRVRAELAERIRSDHD